MKRHKDALFIQAGACNPSAIALTFAEACREMRALPGHKGTNELRQDPALRLMVHQLAYLMGISEYETDALSYNRDVTACEFLKDEPAPGDALARA